MTITTEAPDVDVIFSDDDSDAGTADTTSEQKTRRGRDFTKVSPLHEDLANYVNANSGLPPVSAHQIKAILALRTEFSNSDEQKARREERKAARLAAQSKYAGMSDEQKKAAKAAERAAREAARLEARVAEAKAKAAALANAAAGSGEDLAAAVEADQNGDTPRKMSRRR